ncbi:hypothetical protein [Microvirga pakistanensis]|uniref:hypothetical protein n=1 Tax=Microvirga pakistanensis TaxID=1682650 RepID=UPI001FCEECA5|nr:hypothetical protein [Microvirga pakistanensis]
MLQLLAGCRNLLLKVLQIFIFPLELLQRVSKLVALGGGLLDNLAQPGNLSLQIKLGRAPREHQVP